MIAYFVILIIILAVVFIKKEYRVRNRYVFENETVKIKFLEEKFKNIKGKKEDVECGYPERFYWKFKVVQKAINEGTVKDVVVLHPGKDKNNPWRVFKLIEFDMERYGEYVSVKYLDKPPLKKRSASDKGKLISSIEIFKISDKELENSQEFKDKFDQLYNREDIIALRKRVKGSFNKEDKFDYKNQKLYEPKDQIKTVEKRNIKFCHECGSKIKHINSNFCNECGIALNNS